jgi:HPt (histidine-containing phosphotransfer) domain-containing protein
MKDEFDLENSSKEMPYQVPAGFFDGITQATLQEAKRREAFSAPPQAKSSTWQMWSVAASIAVLLVAAYFLLKGPQTQQPELAQIEKVQGPAVVQDTTTRVVPLPQPATPQKPVKLQTTELAQTTHPKKKNSPAASQKKVTQQPESLENLLAALSDEEVAELAALAETEAYVYEETLLQ